MSQMARILLIVSLHTVKFKEGFLNMKPDVDVIIEIGPHSVLRPFVQSLAPELPYIPTLRRSRNPRVRLKHCFSFSLSVNC